MAAPARPPLHRSLVALLAAALLVLAAACGTEAGDAASPAVTSEAPASNETTDPEPTEPTDDPDADPDGSDDPSPSVDDAAREQIIATYEALGFTPEEASCLADGLVGEISGGELDPLAAMDVINACGIPASRLAELGTTTSTEDGIRAGVAASLRAAGLSDGDAECVADAYLDAYGTDPTALQDPGAVEDLLEVCGLDPSAFSPGG